MRDGRVRHGHGDQGHGGEVLAQGDLWQVSQQALNLKTLPFSAAGRRFSSSWKFDQSLGNLGGRYSIWWCMVVFELFDLEILYMANLRGEVNCLVQPNLLRFDVPRCLRPD
jgi:hypothetical protein